MDMHDIAQLIAGQGPSLRLRQAEVTAVASDGTLSLKIGGSETIVTGVKAFASVCPVVGGSVWVATDGVDVIGLGAIGSRTGIVEMWGGSAASIPAGSLLCDGASYLRTDYPALFAAIGTTWGAADGDHFNVPPKDRFYVAAGSIYATGATGGEATVTASAANVGIERGGAQDEAGGSQGYAWHQISATAHNNLPPYAGLPFIIWT